MNTFITMLLKVLLSKKLIVMALKTYAKHTENKVDDNVCLLVEGALFGNIEKMETGLIGMVETATPKVIDHLNNKKS